MTRQTLERHQVWIYLAAILAGLGFGSLVPGAAEGLELALWPSLGLLLYATFTQVPLARLPAAFRDRRFMAAILFGNFLIVPLFVWGLMAFVPADPAIRLGVLLVLLVPCTDWYITFTHLAGGDTERAIAVTPVNLLVQIGLLPVYLFLFMGNSFLEILSVDRVLVAFGLLILLPMFAAWATERWAGKSVSRAGVVARIGGLPVPLLALVVFLIAASQVTAVSAAMEAVRDVTLVFAAFLIGAAVIGLGLGRLMRLTPASVSALIFSLGTRNSFVVLPLALALGAGWETASVVIVFQSLVELFGMVVYLWAVPRLVGFRGG
ncbi:MAG: arsenic resistance protein [Hyphomonas sp.]